MLDDPDFAAGGVDHLLHRERPELLHARSSADRGTKLLTFLADVTVNQPNGDAPGPTIDPADKLPAVDRSGAGAAGSRQRLLELGPEGVRRRAARPDRASAVTDTTFRDAHQSLLATRVRTRDLAAVGPAVAAADPAAALHRGLGRSHL